MKRARFDYPFEFKTLPEYTSHAGQVVEVLRELGSEESDHHVDPEMEKMFKIKASDGWIGDAFESELIEVTKKGSLVGQDAHKSSRPGKTVTTVTKVKEG
jgi:hypothetical protein